MGEKCYYCDSTETTYCSLCDHWFCDRCRIRYDKRIKDAIKKRIPGWLSREEIEEKEMKVTNDTMGFTIVVEHKSGGKLGTWELTIDEALEVVKRHWDKDCIYARIFPTRFKDRMRLK